MSTAHKRFLIITQVFTPDPAAVGQYFDEAAQAIAKTGAQVTVLTANRGYDNPDERFAAKEDRDGIQIRRLPLSSFGKASIPVRIFAQLSFLVQCILRGLFTPKLTDLLVSTSPPMAAITAVIIGFFKPKLKVHYWVMDINPDQAVVLGAFGSKHPLVRALDWLNRRILQRANNVIALDRFMAGRLLSKLCEPSSKSKSRQKSEKWPPSAVASTLMKREAMADRKGSHIRMSAPFCGPHSPEAKVKRATGEAAEQAQPAPDDTAKDSSPSLGTQDSSFSKIKILPPWPMDQHIEPVAHADNPFRKEQSWQDKFVVMYSGNHSLVHPLDTILDAAEALKDDPRFIFAFIGGGKGKQVVEERIKRIADKRSRVASTPDSDAQTRQTAAEAPKEHFTESSTNQTCNIISLPYQDLNIIKYSLSAADMHVVSLGNNMSGIVHPCKIYGALSIGRPILALAPQESYLTDILAASLSHQPSLISHNRQSLQIGWAIEHGNTTACITALREAADQTQKERTAIGQRAQQLATQQFSREKLLKQFLETIS